MFSCGHRPADGGNDHDDCTGNAKSASWSRVPVVPYKCAENIVLFKRMFTQFTC